MEEEKNEERLMINSQIRKIICSLARNDKFYVTSEKLYAQKTDLVPEKRQIRKHKAEKLKC